MLYCAEMEVLVQRVQHQCLGTDDHHVYSCSSVCHRSQDVPIRVALWLDYHIPCMDKLYHVLAKVFPWRS